MEATSADLLKKEFQGCSEARRPGLPVIQMQSYGAIVILHVNLLLQCFKIIVVNIKKEYFVSAVQPIFKLKGTSLESIKVY